MFEIFDLPLAQLGSGKLLQMIHGLGILAIGIVIGTLMQYAGLWAKVPVIGKFLSK